MLTLQQIAKPLPNDPNILTDDQALLYVQRDVNNPDIQTNQPHSTTYLGRPIRHEHSIRVRARNVVRHNLFNEVTRISVVGKSGAGKSTFDTNFIHEIHTVGIEEFEIQYGVRWVGKKELLHFEKFLKTLAPVDQIIVFEDISYATEMLKKFERVELKESLTTLRHRLGEIHIIFFFNFHYSKALDKMLRDADFKCFCSISDEEKPNMLQLLGYDNAKMITKFEKRHRQMLQNGWWTVKVSNDSDKKFLYYTNNPFRIALFSDLGELHFVLYASIKSDRRVACNLCSPFPIGRKVSPRFIHEELVKEFGSWATTIERNWLFMKGYPHAQNRRVYKGFSFLNNFCSNNYVSLDDYADHVSKISKFKNSDERRSSYKKMMGRMERRIIGKTDAEGKHIAENNISDYFNGIGSI